MPNNLPQLAKLIRYNILASSTAAGSGHPTSSLSAVELMTTLFFGGFFRYDIANPEQPNNDRLIFSKGHASPLFYSLWAAAQGSDISQEELLTLRKFGSRLEGHPTRQFPYTEVATGSLGQGLGDSEMAEGSNWEAMELAAYYKLNNLVGIIDVNRLGQRGETMHGHNLKDFEQKAKAFGWEPIVVDGHNISQIQKAFGRVAAAKKPVMIIAKTIKGKGVSFVENQDGWHGKALPEDKYKQAIVELGKIDFNIRGHLATPAKISNNKKQITNKSKIINPKSKIYQKGEMIATRRAYGDAIAALAQANKQVVVLDAETSNSTYAETVKEKTPRQFFEMFIAEQNMAGAGIGFARRGKIPFVSTFAAFLTRAADQIRMAQYSEVNIKFVGSHAGVSIGEDGASQMALEDLSIFRALNQSVVLYPADAVCAQACVALAATTEGIVYIRTTRANTPVLYGSTEKFKVGGSKVLRASEHDVATVIAAGITLHEAMKAYELLKQKGILIRVIDLYSVKPLDTSVIKKACADTKALIVVEDHYRSGGLYEAVCGSGAVTKPAHSLAVMKMPRSGKPEELLRYEEIDAAAIVKEVNRVKV